MLERLRRELAQKRTKLEGMLANIERETRDMTPDEQTSIDDLMDVITALKTRVDKLEAIEADEPADAPPERSIGVGRRSTPIGQGPAIHGGERQGYSFIRAIRAAADAAEGRGRFDGLEAEVSQEIARRTGRQPKGNLWLPTGGNPEIRALMNRGRPERRGNVDTTTAAGQIFNEVGGDLIDLLRAKLVIRDLGATVLTDMQGVFAIPRQTGPATVQWVAENGSATASNEAYDQIGFLPKTAIAAVGLTRSLLNQTSLDAESLVKTDLAETMARELDRVAINGGASNEPVGILQKSGIISRSSGVQGGTNGAALDFAHLIGMETLITSANADQGQLAYLTNPNVRGKLKQTPKLGTTFPVYLWEKGAKPGEGEVNGYRALTTTNVPSNLTKGSASGVCSAIILGYFKDLVLSLWEGMDTLVNPYSPQLSGGVVISMTMAADIEFKHNESFAIVTDVLTS
jgi:HK97 family phage major capsid protein